MKPKAHLALSLLCLPLALASCGSDTPPPADPLQPFTSQTLNWQPCDPTILGNDSAEKFALLGTRLACADMTVPLDWKRPDRGEASMSLIRVKAEKQGARQGVIFFNPGGPGGDGLGFAPNFGLAWASADASQPLGAQYRKLGEQFDLIGFSPRGVGASTRLYCGTNELLSPIAPPASDRSEANVASMVRMGTLIAKACQKNSLTPYINTDATARDMDLARQLLKEEKLNYIGYSYGTWLGSWYAKLFPAHTGRFLLDGNMPWHSTMQAAFESDPMTFERDYRDVAAPYFARFDALFGLGKTGESVYAAHNTLGEPLRSLVGNFMASGLYSRDALPFMGVVLKSAVVVDGLIKKTPNIETGKLLEQAAAQTYLPDEELNAVAAQIAQELVFVRDMQMNAQPSPAQLDEGGSTQMAVICNDTTWNTDLNFWKARDNEDARKYPLIGGRMVSLPCLYWKGGATVQKPGVPQAMPPLLMLQNEYDPATPKEGALAALNATPNSKMIFIEEEPQHAAFPYGTECVDLPVTEYFLTGRLPNGQIVNCQALPLPGEDRVYPVEQTPGNKLCPAPQTLSSQAVTSRLARQALLDNRRIVEQNGRRPSGLTIGSQTLDISRFKRPDCR